ncbi:MAG: MiaB/RimO family radical SAM methylthiotransferase [Lachnospiraceae bacterium]|nr:MiaB/RimO family radical SAM methylthiotransferase [Lachnospiraceae bacterium]
MKREQNRTIMGKRVAFLTLGCKVNSYETEGMRELFLKAGAVEVDFEEEADIYIVNTCAVTNIADRKSRQMLHRARKRGNGALVVAAGCYAQAAGERLGEQDGVDLVIGNNRKAEIVELTEHALEQRETETYRALLDIAKERRFEELPIETVTEHTRAYIKIEDGCNQFCSYCIIPYVRGRVRSRALSEVLAEIKRLAAEGYREVVLTGIHLSSYGLDRKKDAGEETASEFDATLAEKETADETVLPLLVLLKEAQKVEGIERIRLGSLEPRIMTEAFVKELALLSKICPHFHLSLQSGCDATLKRMNRKYTTAEYKEAVERLRRYFTKPAITTDVIVGFPGETEEEFAETMRFVKETAFSQIHIFKYSRRAGTAADKLEAQIPEPVKAERAETLAELEKELEYNYRKQFGGVTEPVLFEEKVTVDGAEYMVGHTTRYIKAAVPASGNFAPQPNETALVRLSDAVIKDAVAAEVFV